MCESRVKGFGRCGGGQGTEGARLNSLSINSASAMLTGLRVCVDAGREVIGACSVSLHSRA